MKFRYFVLQIFFLLIVVGAIAQDHYTTYVIKKGETLYSIARHFHITEAQLKEFNSLNENSVLKIGQKIKIPSKAAITQKTVVKQTSEIPVNTAITSVDKKQIHIVSGKETLWSISKKYKITVAQLKEWNHLQGDGIHTGQKLMVRQPDDEPASITNTQFEQKVSQPSEQKPVVEKKEVVFEKKESLEQKPVNTTISAKPVGESFFAFAFKNTGNQLSGIAATFKTASGWLDKKYYVLINNVSEGSIVAVSANNKVVYAKVLGGLPDIKEDAGILLRVSNAAASALGIADSKFNITVNY